MDGVQYCAATQRLQLSFRRNSSIANITRALQANKEQYLQAQIVRLSVEDGYFGDGSDGHLPWEKDMRELCRFLKQYLPYLQQCFVQALKLRMYFGVSPFACFPALALKMILNAMPMLKKLRLENLEIVPTPPADNERETKNGGDEVAQALENHPTLLEFGCYECSFSGSSSGDPAGMMDPILGSLATIRTLASISIHQSSKHGRTTISDNVLETLASGCPNLNELELRGLINVGYEVFPKFHHLERLALDLYWIESRLPATNTANNVAANKALTEFLQSNTIRALTFHVHFQQKDRARTNVDRDAELATTSSNEERLKASRKKRKLAALQNLQDAIASSLRYNTSLELLHILVYDDPLSRKQDGPLSCLDCSAFRHGLEHSSSLKHLRLPMCGEMDDGIDFLLRVNQSGLRSLFHDYHPRNQHLLPSRAAIYSSNKTCAPAPTNQERLWHALEDWSYTDLMHVSMVFYCLRENPYFVQP